MLVSLPIVNYDSFVIFHWPFPQMEAIVVPIVFIATPDSYDRRKYFTNPKYPPSPSHALLRHRVPTVLSFMLRV
jgi:hypothetical protein